MIKDDNCVNIPNNTKYWIIRSGIESKFFDEFAVNNCIAVGWDRISNIESIKKMADINSLKKLVFEKYPEISKKENGKAPKNISRKISDISNKIYKFINELKLGDIIVTPGKEEILIGKIVGEPYLITDKYVKIYESYEEELIGELNKARAVKWFKRIERKNLEPNLRLILGVYHGIAHINNTQVITEINRSIFNFYVQENQAHSIFKVNSQEEIDFEKYAFFIRNLQNIYNLLKNDFNNSKLFIKTNVQSPGPIEIIGNNPDLVSMISLASIAIFKNDPSALEKMDINSKKKIIKYKEEYTPEYEYEDYIFPSGGTY